MQGGTQTPEPLFASAVRHSKPNRQQQISVPTSLRPARHCGPIATGPSIVPCPDPTRIATRPAANPRARAPAITFLRRRTADRTDHRTHITTEERPSLAWLCTAGESSGVFPVSGIDCGAGMWMGAAFRRGEAGVPVWKWLQCPLPYRLTLDEDHDLWCEKLALAVELKMLVLEASTP